MNNFKNLFYLKQKKKLNLERDELSKKCDEMSEMSMMSGPGGLGRLDVLSHETAEGANGASCESKLKQIQYETTINGNFFII